MSTALARQALAVQLPGFTGPTPDDDVRRLVADGLGGICLFGSNTADGLDAVARLVADLRSHADGVVVAVDEEGGDVTRLHALDGSPVLGPGALGVVDDVVLTEATGAAVGAGLRALGIDLTLAPVADVNSDPDNPVIGVRSFGADPQLVARHVAAWVVGLRSAGAASCAKHFPGHGDTRTDSHLALPVVATDAETLDARELVPFAAAAEAGCDAVMTAHLVVPALDPARPATLSPVVLGRLRERLGDHRAIVTDALDMAGAGVSGGIPEAAVLALLAGADLLCLGAEVDPVLVRAVQDAVVGAVRSGRLPEERLADAARRSRALRRPCPPPDVDALDADAQVAGARAAIEVGGVLPDLADAMLVRVQTEASIAIGQVPWGIGPALDVRPEEPGALDRVLGAAGGRPVVAQVRDAHRQPAVGALLAGLANATDLVVVELGWPGPHELDVPRVVTHGCSRPTYAALRAVLS